MLDITFLPIKIAHKEIAINLSRDHKPYYDPSFTVVTISNPLLLSIGNDTIIIPQKKNDPSLNPIITNESIKRINDIPIWEIDVCIGYNKECKKKENLELIISETDRSKPSSLQLKFSDKSIDLLSNWGCVKVNFTYKEKDKKDKSGSCFLIVSRYENTFNSINIDLGSEATQISYLAQEENPNGNIVSATNVSMIREIKKGYSKLHIGNNKTEYIQEDPTDNKLYKTGKIIFKKKGKLTESYDDPACILSLLSNRSFLDPTLSLNYSNNNNSMLWEWKIHNTEYEKRVTKHNQKEVYQEEIQDNLTMIGNLKLAYLDPSSLNNIQIIDKENVDEVGEEKTLLNLITYIYKILINIGAQKIKKGENILFTRLLLLMPNLYDQDRANKILKALNQKFNQKFIEHYFSEDTNKTANLEDQLIIETYAISESDASLIGYLRNYRLRVDGQIKDYQINDRFLIIDAGKGTIDYSILQYKDKDSFICQDRGGMAGAGQYLTNIFMKAVGSVFTKTFGNPERYISFLQNVDMGQALILEDFFERLKINYSLETYHKNIEDSQFFKDFLKSIHLNDKAGAINYLKDSFENEKDNWFYTITRPKEFIEKKSLELVQNLVNSLTETKKDKRITGIKFIILTGRGMKLDFFKEQLKSELKKKINYNLEKKMWFVKISNEVASIFPEFSEEMDLKKIAVDLKKITGFSVNSNSNLLITFDNKQEVKSSFSEIQIEKKQLKRFNYEYTADKNNIHNNDTSEIASIIYLGMQSEYAFALKSNEGYIYYAEAGKDKEYRNFLTDTLFTPGKSIKPNSYNTFMEAISFLGIKKVLESNDQDSNDLDDTSQNTNGNIDDDNLGEDYDDLLNE